MSEDKENLAKKVEECIKKNGGLHRRIMEIEDDSGNMVEIAYCNISKFHTDPFCKYHGERIAIEEKDKDYFRYVAGYECRIKKDV